MLVYGNYECFVMQMLYACVLRIRIVYFGIITNTYIY